MALEITFLEGRRTRGTKVCFAPPAGYNFDSTAFVPRASRLLLCELRIPRGAFLVSQDAISCERTKVCFAHPASYCFGSTTFVPRASRLLLCELRIHQTANGRFFLSNRSKQVPRFNCENNKQCFGYRQVTKRIANIRLI